MENSTPTPSSNSNGLMSVVRVVLVLCILSLILWVVIIIWGYLKTLSPESSNVITVGDIIYLGNSPLSFILGFIAVALGASARKRDDIRNNIYVRWLLLLGIFEIIIPIVLPFIAIFFGPGNLG